jgi:hypothetical protein
MSVRSDQPLSYTVDEVKSYLPTGWSLTAPRGENPGTWDAKARTWKATVLDNVEFDWPVVVRSWEASSLGRIEALRQAMDKVFRERLG